MRHPQSIERVVTSVGSAPGLSEGHLVDLFRCFPRLASQHDWAEAILGRGTVSAVQAVLALIQKGRLGAGPGAVDSWWLSRQIAHAAKSDPALAEEILHECAPSGAQHRILEHAIEEIGGVPGVMALVRGYARAGKRFDGSMHQALRRRRRASHSGFKRLRPPPGIRCTAAQGAVRLDARG